MVFNVTYIVCKGPKLDAYKSPIVTPMNCQYDTIRQHKLLFQEMIYLRYDI